MKSPETLPTEKLFADSLRAVEVPPMPSSLLNEALTTKRPRRNRWALPTGFVAGTATAALAIAFLFSRPTPSVAAPSILLVQAAHNKVQTYTIRTLDCIPRLDLVFQNDGKRWRSDVMGKVQIMDGTQLIDIEKVGNQLKALHSPARPFSDDIFPSDAQSFLKHLPDKTETLHHYLWQGQYVDRYWAKHLFPYRDAAGNDDSIYQEGIVYASEKTHLPLQVTYLRKSHPTGKILSRYTLVFDYSPIPHSVFEFHLPAGAIEATLQSERIRIVNAVKDQGAILIDPTGFIDVVVPNRADLIAAHHSYKLKLAIDGQAKTHIYSVLGWVQQHEDRPRKDDPEYRLLRFQEPNAEPLRALSTMTVQLNGETFQMPVLNIPSDTEAMEIAPMGGRPSLTKPVDLSKLSRSRKAQTKPHP